MRRILLRIFFHVNFWPAAFWQLLRLPFRRERLRFDGAGVDRAFYYEGSTVVLRWRVQGAWLVRVSHPGGFYTDSDRTWFRAEPGMPVLRVTAYGLGRRIRREFPVFVKPVASLPSGLQRLQPRWSMDRVHRGPVLRPRGQAYSALRGRWRLDQRIHALRPGTGNATATLLHQVLLARSQDDLHSLSSEMNLHAEA